MRLEDHLTRQLDALEARDLRRRPASLESAQGRHVRVDGRRVLNFTSNDYLGLASDPRLRSALQRALDETSAGAGASRLLSGTLAPHVEAERALASFCHSPAARLFSTGYAANVGTLPALVGRGDTIFSDALNHASIIDGARLSRATIHRYPHADITALDALLQEHRANSRNAIIVTDGVFSMDGDVAPLAELAQIANAHDAWLYVDEAHSLGLYGEGGRGVCHAAGIVPDVLIGTLGKTFGVAGAFAAGSEALVDWLLQKARSFVFSTAPMPAQAAVVLTAVELVRHADDARARAFDNAEQLRAGLAAIGQPRPAGDGPIVPLVLGSAARTMTVAASLLERGLLVQGVRPPTVPEGESRLRIVPNAGHTEADIDQLITSIQEALA